MKVFKNQTKDNAKQNGFLANFSFASDPIMSPNGIDITRKEFKDKDGKTVSEYEIIIYEKETDTARIEVLSQKEYDSLLKENHIYSHLPLTSYLAEKYGKKI